MEDTIKSNTPIQIGKILKQSLLLYKDNIYLFVGIVVLGNVPMMIDPVMQLPFIPKIIGGCVSFIMALACIFVAAWANIALTIAASERWLNNKVSLKECFLRAKGIYWRFIGVSLMYLLFLGAGLLLFFMPGIYYGTIFSLAPIVVILECKDVKPFQESRALVKGSFWKVFVLNIIMLLLLISCTYFIRLASINYNIAKLLADTFVVLGGSYLTVITVVLYHRLKEKRGNASLQQHAKSTSRKSKGCLGCFGAIGLAILIAVLTTFWISGLKEYFKTERGAQVSEYIKKTISTQIVIPGGATLERPKGWYVLKFRGSDPEIKYELDRFGVQKIKLWAIPIKDLNISKAVLTLENQIIADKILLQIKQPLVVEKCYTAFNPQPSKTMTLGDRNWGECDYVLALKSDYFVWKNIYTIFGDHVLVVSRKYNFKYKNGDIKIQEDLLNEDKEMQDIISTIKFP